MKKTDVERLLRWMVMNKYLYEESSRQETGNAMYAALITTVRIMMMRATSSTTFETLSIEQHKLPEICKLLIETLERLALQMP